jgi:hypothetical protein
MSDFDLPNSAAMARIEPALMAQTADLGSVWIMLALAS